MEGVLALMIPVLALATGLVAVLRMPPEALARRRGRHLPPPAPATEALEAMETEVALLRDEVAAMKERLDFTERLLMDGQPAARLAPAAPAEPAAPAANS